MIFFWTLTVLNIQNEAEGLVWLFEHLSRNINNIFIVLFILDLGWFCADNLFQEPGGEEQGEDEQAERSERRVLVGQPGHPGHDSARRQEPTPDPVPRHFHSEGNRHRLQRVSRQVPHHATLLLSFFPPCFLWPCVFKYLCVFCIYFFLFLLSRSEYLLSFSDAFELSDDFVVLKQLGLANGSLKKNPDYELVHE